MKEIQEFIKGLECLEYKAVAIGETFEEDLELVKLDELMDRIEELGLKEIVAVFHETFEFISNDGKYIEINGVY